MERASYSKTNPGQSRQKPNETYEELFASSDEVGNKPAQEPNEIKTHVSEEDKDSSDGS